MAMNHWRAFLKSRLLESAFSPFSERAALLFYTYAARNGLQLLQLIQAGIVALNERQVNKNAKLLPFQKYKRWENTETTGK